MTISLRRLALVLAGPLALAPAAAPGNDLVTLAGATTRLWRSVAALEAAGPGDAIACEVARGTRARVSRVPGSYAFQAEVAEGPHAGCRGVIAPRDFETGAGAAPGPLSQERVGPPPAAPSGPAREAQWALWEHIRDGMSNAADRIDEWKEIVLTDKAFECDAAKREVMRRHDRDADTFAEHVLQTQLRRRGKSAMSRVAAVPHPDGWDFLLTRRDEHGQSVARLELRLSCHPVSQPPNMSRRGTPR